MAVYNKLKELIPGVQEGVLLKDYTTYKIGGPAKYFFSAKSDQDLIGAIRAAKKMKLPIFILGGGSNILISDKGFNGLVIKIDLVDINFNGEKVIAEAGVNLIKLAYFCAEKNITGLEWGAGIPGTLGGAIFGHAQAFNVKISECIENVKVLDLKTLKIKSLTKKQCGFSLKNSVFKKNKNLVILSALLKFKFEDSEKVREKIKNFLAYREAKHPINFPSAGSTFVNPEMKIKNKILLEKFSELSEYNKVGVVPAGYLIAKSGLSGKRVGFAQISEKHANFIINLGDAKAKDVLALINLAKTKVKKNFKIELVPEVQFIGFSKKA